MADWTVIGDEPAAGGQSENGWTVVGETPSRGRRGPRSPNGSPTAPTRGQGATPDNPIPYGGRAQRGQYIVAGDGTTMLRGNDGVFRRVELPGVNSGGGFNGMTRRDAQRRQAASANVQAPRPERGVLDSALEDFKAPMRSARDNLLSAFNADMGDIRANRAMGGRTVPAAAGLVLSPVSGAINLFAAPAGRAMTDAGIGNDATNTNALSTASMLLAPERPRGGFAAAAGNPLAVAGGRFGAVPAETPRPVPPPANAFAEPAPRPVPRPAAQPGAPLARRQSQVDLLRREGVEVTPGQKRGGVWSGIEDRATSTPILGDAINEARNQSRLALNRAVANRALAPIGENLPGSVATGSDAVGYVESRIGDAYGRAAGAVKSAQADNELLSDLGAIREANATDLPPPLAEQWDKIIGDRVTARFANGPIDGAMLKEIQSELGALASKYSASSDGAQRIFGERLLAARDALGGLVGRASPEAAKLQAQADRAWANFVRFQTAAAQGGEGGVFTPAQLRAAVKASDKSVRKGAVARGDAMMQDIADAAVGVMNSKVPDSGTAGRNMQMGLGMLVGSNPVTGAVTAGGLGAASIPYRVMARRLAEAALRDGATKEEVQSSLTQLRALASADPKAAAGWLKRVEQIAKAYGIIGNETKQPTP